MLYGKLLYLLTRARAHTHTHIYIYNNGTPVLTGTKIYRSTDQTDTIGTRLTPLIKTLANSKLLDIPKIIFGFI